MLVLEVMCVAISSPFFPAGRGWTEINVYNQYAYNNSLTIDVDEQQTSGSN